jgi:uncharacterized protein YpuA (DUF1002 family)
MIGVVEVYQTYNMKEAGNLNKAIIELFCNMAKELNIDFAPFIPLIQDSLNKHKKPSADFNNHVEHITKINLIDLFKENLKNIGNEEL